MHKASLKGWERVWCRRPPVEQQAKSTNRINGLDIAFLSVQPSDRSEIDGMLVEDCSSVLPELDIREALYDRHNLETAMLSFTDKEVRTANATSNTDAAPHYIYVAQDEYRTAVLQSPPVILRSYLDAVMQGFLRAFGENGLSRFVETTAKFHFPVLEDREAPIYPRSVKISNDEKALFGCVVPEGGFASNDSASDV